MQRNLFEPPDLHVQPAASLTAPRLWVRRLVLWSEPGVVLRDISLRPGLNIIWSPDPEDSGAQANGRNAPSGPGHGAGKTLVCRMLRYCLGEPHFAPDTQRAKIRSVFKDGRVGAEVVVDGVALAVVRSIGVLPHDVVLENSTLEAAVAGDTAATSMSPLFEAISRCIVPPDVAEIITDNPERAWLLAMAWITRDQECRFEKTTDWRSASSDSGSPARKLSVGDATNVMRALLGAITPKEHRLKDEIEKLGKQRDRDIQSLERQRWVLSQSTARIIKAVGLKAAALPEGNLLTGLLRNKARERVARVSVVNTNGEMASLEDLEAEHEKERDEVQRLECELMAVENSRANADAVAKLIESEAPGLSVSLDDAEMPTCPTCEVPIDRALVEGCKFSHKLPDFKTLRMRQDKNGEELRAKRVEVERARSTLTELNPRAEAARMRRDAAWKKVVAARHLRNERSEAWYSARRLGDDITELEGLLELKTTAELRVAKLDMALQRKREEVESERDRHEQTFVRLEEHFDPLVRRLLGKDARGRVHHDGNGLHLTVEYGGERSTPAIDSVKVLAFDLATLCRSIEGGTYMPGLLVHDSPREADLGLSIYHQLFRFIVELEGVGPAPLFQYIVTTTTRPPVDLAVEPWVRLTLNGSPAKERLLGRDL